MSPDQAIIVTLTPHGVSCQRPGHPLEAVAWADLKLVLVETTNQGPWGPDVYWILVGEHGGCVVPQGATGEEALVDRLQQLPEFNNDTFIEAMASVENRRFVCWERPAAPAL